MKKIVFLLSMMGVILSGAEYKVVFDLMSGDATKVSKRLINNVNALKTHYESQGDTLKVAVVISGDSYKFFVKDLTDSPYADTKGLSQQNTLLQKHLAPLLKAGTEFKVCSIGMKKRDISKASLYEYVVPAFNKTAALIEYQNAGYAYIPLK